MRDGGAGEATPQEPQRDLPAADVPVIYKSFDALKERLPHEPIHHHNRAAVQPLSLGLETPGGGRPEFISGQDSRQFDRIELARVSTVDAAADTVDDSSLAGNEWRGSGADPSQVGAIAPSTLSPETTESLRRLSDKGTGTSVVVDPGVGRDICRLQRNPGNQVSTDQWINVSSRHPTDSQTQQAWLEEQLRRRYLVIALQSFSFRGRSFDFKGQAVKVGGS